jgi:hypothetical protein
METITQFIKDYKEIIALIFPLLVTLWVLVRTQRRWLQRRFFDRVAVSLNYVVNGSFEIRTLQERSCMEVFRNSSVVNLIIAAAKKKNEEAILDLPEKDYWYVLNLVLNTISEQFAVGFVREEAGCNSCPVRYLLFLTGGQDKSMRQNKIRALLIREELLLQTADFKPQFKNEFRGLRWQTLQKVRQEWVDTQGKTKRIREIFLAV